MIRLETHGDNFIDLSDEIVEDTRVRLKGVALRASALLLAKVQQLLRLRVMASNRHGHGTSAPEGEPPAYQTGDLWRSFTKLPVRFRENTVSTGVKSSEDYKKIGALEYGSVILSAGTPGSDYAKRQKRSGLKTLGVFHIKPRPFMRPAEAAVESEIEQLMEAAL